MNPYLPGSAPNFWLSCMTIDPASKVTPLDVMVALEQENIESRPIWKPMHMQPVFAGNDFIQVRDGASVGENEFFEKRALPAVGCKEYRRGHDENHFHH